MPDPTLYLFDGYNLLHAGGYEDPRELGDAGQTEFAPHRLSERLDAETREKLEKLRRGQKD